jgi:hypothetical protein
MKLEERATNFETMTHIHQVAANLNRIIKLLLDRGEEHDRTKLASPEVEAFTEVTHKLSASTYGSEEYNETKRMIAPALVHHYAKNRHHPEHYANGVDDMNIVDLVEMLCDWAASCKRHDDGNLRKSIEINGKRFNMSSQLVRILDNSIPLFEE